MARSRRYRKPSPRPAPRKRFFVRVLEDRILPTTLGYLALCDTPLTLQLPQRERQLQIVSTKSPTEFLASRSLQDTTGDLVDGTGHDVELTLDNSVPQAARPAAIPIIQGESSQRFSLTRPAGRQYKQPSLDKGVTSQGTWRLPSTKPARSSPCLARPLSLSTRCLAGAVPRAPTRGFRLAWGTVPGFPPLGKLRRA
jgi:hypothetical protein